MGISKLTLLYWEATVVDLMMSVRDSIKSRLYSHNHSLSKSESVPVYIDEEEATNDAMDHLIEALTDLALEDTIDA